ncbi:hypothetical protein GCM10009122_22800 [Fulvivirga kasyanovii]|uniref:Uncharacterized protein n=1 Tax=Fulvivirga kasyanovii TaxID=396812 RepID=A0ABW9RQ57_9BACT|nr:hypothetical protein [Fulvivirga kasyanovii]MTI26302.1 hypothetical protein [Fulvivirga kasyanovii]
MEKVKTQIINAIMDKAHERTKACGKTCRDFRVMTSPKRKNTLILRWTSINIDDPDRPVQCYHYECFHMDGIPHDCSIHYADQAEANEFFEGLKTLYQQTFSNDHRIICTSSKK